MSRSIVAASASASASTSRRAALPRGAGYPALGVLLRPFTAAAGLTRAGAMFAWRRRRLRVALLAVLIALPLLGGGLWLLRHSSLTAVEHVQLSGVDHGHEAGAIAAALTVAAHGMSTLAVKPAVLSAAVAQFPIVRSVRARASFPHGLHIEVLEQPPVAALVLGGVHTAVAADGVVLGPGYLSSSLPAVNVGQHVGVGVGADGSGGAGSEADAVAPSTGASVRGTTLLQTLAVLGAAPAPLAKLITRAYSGPEGVTVVLRGGLLAYFGDATRSHAKWLSLVRVLADSSSAGAAYIDVRLPERPAAGFAPGTVRPDASTTGSEPGSASDPNTAAELAAGLDAAVGGSASTGSAGVGTGASTGSAASTATAAGTGVSDSPEPSTSPAAPTAATTAGSTENAAAAPTENTAATSAETTAPEH